MRSINQRFEAAKQDLAWEVVQIAATEKRGAPVGIGAKIIRNYTAGKVAVLGFIDQKLNPPFTPPGLSERDKQRQAYEEYDQSHYYDGLTQE